MKRPLHSLRGRRREPIRAKRLWERERQITIPPRWKLGTAEVKDTSGKETTYRLAEVSVNADGHPNHTPFRSSDMDRLVRRLAQLAAHLGVELQLPADIQEALDLLGSAPGNWTPEDGVPP